MYGRELIKTFYYIFDECQSIECRWSCLFNYGNIMQNFSSWVFGINFFVRCFIGFDINSDFLLCIFSDRNSVHCEKRYIDFLRYKVAWIRTMCFTINGRLCEIRLRLVISYMFSFQYCSIKYEWIMLVVAIGIATLSKSTKT